MKEINKSSKSLSWYHAWHRHPRHQHAHWLFFFAVLTVVSSFLFSELGNLQLENINQAKAQGNLTLGISGNRLTINGTPQFLIMVSYFDAMAASNATLDSDFSRLRSLGFSGVRIFPDWAYGSNPSQLLDSNGNFRSGALSRLTNILQRAQNNSLIVDISFDRGLVSGRSASSMITGIRNTAQAITAYRNVYFDLTNEADHDGTTCGTARFCPSEARQARDAVKAVDPQRIVSISLNSGSIDPSYTVNGGMDFTLVHGPFSTFNSGTTSSLLSNVVSQIPGLPVHFQEPDRCRSSSCRYSSGEFIAAASEAKCGGAAGWNFHTGGGYSLSGGTMFNNWVDPNVENAVANGLASALAGVTWGNCGGGPTPSGSPPPSGPSPRYIYYITPSTAQVGDTIIISGQNLTPTVTFLDPSGSPTQIQGVLNTGSTQVTVVIPPTLPPNTYNVQVGPNPNSNKVSLQVILSSPPPPGPSATSPATPCDPATIQIATQNNVSIICDFGPTPVYPGDTVTMTGVFLVGTIYMTPAGGSSAVTINGNVNSTGDLVTFLVPANTAPGDYGLSNAGVHGNASIAKILSVQISTVNQPPNPPFPPPPALQPTPPATQFQDLISNAFNYSLIVVGIAVFIMIMWGGFLWLTSAANPGNIATAKRYIFNAILGAILLISAYVILYTINPELVGGSFNLGGIQTTSTQANATVKLVATNEIEAASAINSGCTMILDTRDFSALECDQATANSLNLIPDPVLSSTDTALNNQIGATVIQNNGNSGAGRKIVILDTGYDYNNPDLRSSYLPGGRDFINNDNDPMDDNTSGSSAPGHGSHVAGIITGDGINSRAMGVAPQAGIISGKILDSAGNGNWSNLTDAIYWAVNGPDGIRGTSDDFNADIINISIGGGNFNSFCDNTDPTTQLMTKAIKYARDNGVLPVISSGNIATGVSMPGCIDAAFTVGAVDNSDRIANFSGRGSPVDIVAPGVNIYSSLLGTNYGLKSGTSMATPAVSGAAALLKSANPNQTPDQLEKLMTSTACDLGQTGKDTIFGWGRISLTSGSCTPPPSGSPAGPTGTIMASPTSCTKGVLPSNLNCDTNISYSITGITTATQLTVGKDNNFLQNIQCSSSPCNGQFSDNNPNAGLHQYDIRIVNNIIAKGNSYIFTRGNLTANFGSCQLGNPGNPNCNVTLYISAPGVSPNSIVVTRDGVNWRLIPCTTPTCSSSINDTGPAVGTHTYTIRDSSDNTNGRLGRVTVVISPSASGPSTCSSSPNEVMELCTGTNYTGTCSQFSCHEKTNFSGSSISGQIIRSARIIRTGSGISDARIYTCDTGWVHPNPSSTEPTPCLWLDFNTTTQVPDVWNSGNNWCYWTWVNGTAQTFCRQPLPTSPGINIKSYGSL